MRYATRLAVLTGPLTIALLLGPGSSDAQAQFAARRAARTNRAPAPANYYQAPAPGYYYYYAPAVPAPANSAAPTGVTRRNRPATRIAEEEDTYAYKS